MRVVVDTNVIVSGVMSRGSPPHQILHAWRRGAFELVTSPMLLGEMQRVLARTKIARRLRWSARRQAAFAAILRRRATVVDPARQIHAITADPDDNRVLEAAAECHADYIVTGDRAVLDLKRHEGTKIVTPRRFLVILTTEAAKP